MTDSDMRKALERIKNTEINSNITEPKSEETQLSLNRHEEEKTNTLDEDIKKDTSNISEKNKTVKLNTQSNIDITKEKDTIEQSTPKEQKIEKTFTFIHNIVKDVYNRNNINELNYNNLLLQKYNSRLLNTNIYYICFRMPNNMWLIFKIDKVNIDKTSPFVKCKLYNTSLPQEIQNNPSYKKIRNYVENNESKTQTIYFNRDNYNFEQPMKNILEQYLFYQ